MDIGTRQSGSVGGSCERDSHPQTNDWTNTHDHYVAHGLFNDRFETRGAAGGSTNRTRYAVATDYTNSVASIVSVRLGATDMNVYRYIGCHRVEKGSRDNGSEPHPQNSWDGRMVAVGSNWRMPSPANGPISDVKTYVWLIPDAWWSPNNDRS